MIFFIFNINDTTTEHDSKIKIKKKRKKKKVFPPFCVPGPNNLARIENLGGKQLELTPHSRRC